MARVKTATAMVATTTTNRQRQTTLIPKTRKREVKAITTSTSASASRPTGPRHRPVSRREAMNRMSKMEFSHIVPAQDGCIRRNGTLMDQILTLYRIGGESKNGEALKSCYPIICSGRKCTCDTNNPDFMTLVVKKVPLYNRTPLINPVTDKITSPRWTKYDVYAEIVAMELCRFLIYEDICPNLPMLFSYFPCADCQFNNAHVVAMNGGSPHQNCILLLTEFADIGDLEHWLKDERTLAEWLNMYFQVFMGIAALQRYYNMTHYDLHWGNVLLYTIPERGGVWRYTLDGREYDCPNLGFRAIVWDFGYAHIPGVLEIDEELHNKNRDSWATYGYPPGTVDYSNISGAPEWMEDEYPGVHVPEYIRTEFEDIIDMRMPIEQLIAFIYGERYAAKPTSKILNRYSLDKPLTLPMLYSRFLKGNPNVTTTTTKTKTTRGKKRKITITTTSPLPGVVPGVSPALPALPTLPALPAFSPTKKKRPRRTSHSASSMQYLKSLAGAKGITPQGLPTRLQTALRRTILPSGLRSALPFGGGGRRR